MKPARESIVPEGAYDIRRVGDAVLGYRLLPDADRPRRWSLDIHRVGEIEALIEHRHGAVVDTDDGAVYLEVVAPHLPDDDARRAWARRWLPALAADDVEAVLVSSLRRMKAIEIGAALCVTLAERQALSLRSIRASGQTDEDVAVGRRERHAAAARAKRAAQPKRSKLSEDRPWEAEGISRRTWYRRRQAGGTKSVSNSTSLLIAHAICATPGGAATRPRAANLADSMTTVTRSIVDLANDFQSRVEPLGRAVGKFTTHMQATQIAIASSIRAIKARRSA